MGLERRVESFSGAVIGQGGHLAGSSHGSECAGVRPYGGWGETGGAPQGLELGPQQLGVQLELDTMSRFVPDVATIPGVDHGFAGRVDDFLA